ncbi:MAG: nucleotidyltransferase domain-containing protein [Pirellulales bacterium]
MVSAIVEKQADIHELCARFGVERLEVFGSATSDEEFDPRRSDLDFIVEFAADQDLGPWLRNYFAFRDELSNLFGYPVDLVMSSAMKNPYFIREANHTRRLLYGT